MSEPLTPEREAEIREWVEAMGKQKDIRYYGSWQQHGELLGEIDRLRSQAAELEQGPALPWAAAMDDSDLHMFLSDLVSAALHHWHQGPEVPPREVLRLVEKACANWRTPGQGYRSDEPTAAPWQRAVDGLNALVDAGVPFHIEPDGHISNPFGDEHIEWDREAERWRFVIDEPELVEVKDPCHPCGCPKRFNRHADGCPALSVEGGDVHG